MFFKKVPKIFYFCAYIPRLKFVGFTRRYRKKNPNLKYDMVYINQDWLNRDMPDYATKYTFAATQLNQTLEVFYDILFGKIFITI